MKFLRDLISRKRAAPVSEPRMTAFPPSPGPNGELGFRVTPSRVAPSSTRSDDPPLQAETPVLDAPETANDARSEDAKTEDAVTEYLADAETGPDAETGAHADAETDDAIDDDADAPTEIEPDDTVDGDDLSSLADDEFKARLSESQSGGNDAASKLSGPDTAPAEAETDPEDDVVAEPAPALTEDTEALLKDISEKSQAISAQSMGRSKGASIWDLDEDVPSADEIAVPAVPTAPRAPDPVETPIAAPVRASARQRRNKTRLIGFDKSDGGVVDLFDGSKAAAPTLRAKFPVGWILVIEGPGRGECFSLLSGMSQIGRGEDQAIQLDFGDNAISRNNHAAIVYDPQTRSFLLGHGGKANIVRLNNTPVISNEPLNSGDIIQIGETKLRLVTLCGDDFDWSDEGPEENEDVAIA